jgi:hypothetical protein
MTISPPARPSRPARRARLLLGCAVVALLAACRETMPAPAAAPEPSPSPAAAAPRAPAPLLKEAVALEPVGTVALSASSEVVVDAGATFRIELSRPCADARVLLLDARDALVEAAGTQELGGGTRLTLAPTAPLVRAGRYTLKVDGATTRELHDGAGEAHAPLTFALLVAGAPPAPEPKAKAKAKAKKRRR